MKRDFSAALAAVRRPTPGALDLVKSVAFAAMLADHTNKVLLKEAVPWLSSVGRVALPCFAYALAVNLLRHTRDAQAYFTRLMIWGALSQPLWMWASGRQSLNILFTLALGLQLVLLVEAARQAPTRRARLASLSFTAVTLAASLATDYQLGGALLVLCIHAWLAQPATDRAVLVLLVLAALNLRLPDALPALAAVPLTLVLVRLGASAPRFLRGTFYPLYPAHLALLRLAAQA